MNQSNDLAAKTTNDLRTLLAQISFKLNGSSRIEPVEMVQLRNDVARSLTLVGSVEYMLLTQSLERDAFRGELHKVVDRIVDLQAQLDPPLIRSSHGHGDNRAHTDLTDVEKRMGVVRSPLHADNG